MESLELARFRNYRRAKFAFAHEGSLIVGRNGSGKTNLLDGFSIYAQLGGEDEINISVMYRRDRGKRISVDGSPLKRMSQLLGRFRVVSFSPDDMRSLVSPAGRRKILDTLLSQVGGYIWHWQRYRRALIHRNRLISEGKGRRELRPWDLQVVKFGSEIVKRRTELMVWMGDKVKEFYGVLGGGEDVEVLYIPSFPVD